jgi:hypothetical protein
MLVLVVNNTDYYINLLNFGKKIDKICSLIEEFIKDIYFVKEVFYLGKQPSTLKYCGGERYYRVIYEKPFSPKEIALRLYSYLSSTFNNINVSFAESVIREKEVFELEYINKVPRLVNENKKTIQNTLF